MFMEILISHISALAYWRTVGPGFLRDDRARRKATRKAHAASASSCKPQLSSGGRRPAGCTLPLDVIVSNMDSRVNTSDVRSCLWKAPFPDASFVDAGMGFLISSPEFCFLQMASRMSLVQLIQLGFELCGTYEEHGEGPVIYRTAPLTSVAKLSAFVERSQGARGCKKAARALRYVQDGSASPMETVLVMMLCLPYGLGGYGIARPRLNYRVDVPQSMRKLADRSYCVCDECWPDLKLACEYDSDLFHFELDRRESDARRRNTLLSLGYAVVTVSRDQVIDGGSFNRLAHQLAKKTGKRLRYRDPQFTRKHLELRAELFASLRSGGWEIEEVAP